MREVPTEEGAIIIPKQTCRKRRSDCVRLIFLLVFSISYNREGLETCISFATFLLIYSGRISTLLIISL